jgi:hypothetical protein
VSEQEYDVAGIGGGEFALQLVPRQRAGPFYRRTRTHTHTLPTHTMAAQLFNAAVLTLFFEDANNMGLSHRTRLQLAVEGIAEPEDFMEFNDDGMMAIFMNLLKPSKVPALGAAARAAGTLQEIQAYEVSAKSKMRLKGAMLIAKFYDNVGRTLDADNMSWPVIKCFWSSGRL